MLYKTHLIGKHDPRLRAVCVEVDYKEDHINLINHLFTIMDAKGGVGLAAPQVGVLERIMVVNVNGFRQAFVNPIVTKQYGGKHTAIEGCLSFTGACVKVVRSRQIVVEAYDQNGIKFRRKLKNLLACVVQHEVDHLNGVCIK